MQKNIVFFILVAFKDTMYRSVKRKRMDVINLTHFNEEFLNLPYEINQSKLPPK